MSGVALRGIDSGSILSVGVSITNEPSNPHLLIWFREQEDQRACAGSSACIFSYLET